jgi:hypothetical protein
MGGSGAARLGGRHRRRDERNRPGIIGQSGSTLLKTAKEFAGGIVYIVSGLKTFVETGAPIAVAAG